MDGILQAVQTVIAEAVAVAAAVCSPVHGGDVAVVASRAVVVGQRLGELRSADTRQRTLVVARSVTGELPERDKIFTADFF